MASFRVLGAFLAGGASSRFGSDKALAMIGERPLIEHTADALAAQVDALVICGRPWGDWTWISDRPTAGLGPLGGLNAALHHAHENGFDAVLCAPVDVFPLPTDLLARLAGDQARTLLRQYAVGFWPARLAPMLDQQLASGVRSIHAWIAATGALAHDDEALGLRNINLREHLPTPSKE